MSKTFNHIKNIELSRDQKYTIAINKHKNEKASINPDSAITESAQRAARLSCSMAGQSDRGVIPNFAAHFIVRLFRRYFSCNANFGIKKRYVLLGVILCLGILVSYLSFNAFAQMKSPEPSLEEKEAAEIDRVKAVEENFERLLQEQKRAAEAFQKSLSGVNQRLDKQTEEMSEVAIDSNMLRVEINDIKSDNRELLNRYIELSDEVERISPPTVPEQQNN